MALAVFAINLLAWHAALQLVFAMVRQMSAMEAQAAEDITFPAVCLSMAAATRLRPRRKVCAAQGLVRHVQNRRAGVTLSEVLVVVAIAMVLFSLVAASVAMARQSTVVSLAVSEAVIVRLVMPTLLHELVGAAGRGIDDGAGTACSATVEDEGRRLVLRFVELTEHIEEHVFAARDGTGRPALNIRRPPHPRQPWIEDVTGFSVVPIEDTDWPWVRAVHLDVEHAALAVPLRVAVPLLHHACVVWSAP